MALAGTGCSGDSGSGGEGAAPGTDSELAEGDIEASTGFSRSPGGTALDWGIFRSTVTWAWEEGLDTLPLGEAMVEIGLSFVGAPYTPGTLEVPGPEDVVVNLEEFDCVTLVENVLALARFVRLNDPAILESETESRARYRGALREIRYRGARVEGYPSRLHYFSDWINDNEAKGLVREVTEDLGGELEYRAIDYMSTHPESYWQLADLVNRRAIEETEASLSGLARFKIPEGEIENRVSGIRNGDIIAATSTVEGLDVAHTGLAFWQGSSLHLLHAPLVGEVVEVSRLPLAERIARLQGQDGIRVVRPVDPNEFSDS